MRMTYTESAHTATAHPTAEAAVATGGTAEPNDDRVRSGGIRRLPRRDGATRVFARVARLAAIRRPQPTLSPERRPGLDQSRRANTSLIISERSSG